MHLLYGYQALHHHEEPPVKQPTHQYSDPYNEGRCLECGRSNKLPASRNCRDQYHGWQVISERAEAQRQAFIRRNGR
jgi:hypothetical protein